MEKNEQILMDQETVDKVKVLSYKQDVIRKIVLGSVLLIELLLFPFIWLFKTIPLIIVFVILGIGIYLGFLWYLYMSYLWIMRLELAGWGYYYKADNSNPQFEIIFNDGTYYTKDLVEAFQSYSKRIISVKKMDKS